MDGIFCGWVYRFRKTARFLTRGPCPLVLPCCADTLWNAPHCRRCRGKRNLSTSSAERSSAPSPQGEGLKVRVLRHHRAAHPRPLPHFQSSMLLHNLSRNFSLSKKASQRALRCTRALHRTAAITHPAANTHQATPCPPITDAHSTRPAASLHLHRPHLPQIRFSTISPQTFPHFRRFSTAAFFPLGFL